MSRLIDQPIQVTSRPSHLARSPEPVAFTWRGTRYRVTEILDTWEEAGRWWEQEPPATSWRVRVHSGGVVEFVILHMRPPE
jgi:hypothetical protein